MVEGILNINIRRCCCGRPGIVATAAAPATTAAAAAAAGFTISSSAVGNKCFAFEQRKGLRNSDGVIEEARAQTQYGALVDLIGQRHPWIEVVVIREMILDLVSQP